MKIVHLLADRKLPRQPDTEGASGLVRAVLGTARAQAALGHEVSVAAVGRESWRTEWSGVHLIGLAAAPWARVRLNGRVIDFRLHLPYVLFAGRHRFDAVHGHLHHYLRFIHSPRRIAHFHSDPFCEGSENATIGLTARDFARVSRSTDAQVAISAFVARQLERGLARSGNVHVVYNGVDLSRLAPERFSATRIGLRREWGVKEQDVVFLFAGAIIPDKGVIHLARAFARVAANNPSVHLAIAGSTSLWGSGFEPVGSQGTYEASVKEALRSSLDAGRVHFLGKVAYENMPETYAAADALVLPSIVKEGASLAVLEAMAAERPVIAPNVGGPVELVDERNGILVAPGDESGLNEAMQALANCAGTRKKLGLTGREKAQGFSWTNTARKIDAVYRTISKGGSR